MIGLLLLLTLTFARAQDVSSRDAAVMHSLDARAATAAAEAVAAHAGTHDTWLVEVAYPNAQVATKLAVAVKLALMGQGARVSDRAVSGASRMLTHEAACLSLAADGQLPADTVLLALVLRDPRETVLHAGLCRDGRWTWL